MRINIINGPNLNLLGKRETNIYGTQNFEDYLNQLRNQFPAVNFSFYQSNIEGELINAIQKADCNSDGIILNPGGYAHTSVAIGDAIASVEAPVVEVHISNIFARESFRSNSYVSSKCKGVISGLGLKGYELALLYLMNLHK